MIIESLLRNSQLIVNTLKLNLLNHYTINYVVFKCK